MYFTSSFTVPSGSLMALKLFLLLFKTSCVVGYQNFKLILFVLCGSVGYFGAVVAYNGFGKVTATNFLTFAMLINSDMYSESTQMGGRNFSVSFVWKLGKFFFVANGRNDCSCCPHARVTHDTFALYTVVLFWVIFLTLIILLGHFLCYCMH